MRFYLQLGGASKDATALLQPCGSYSFIYNTQRNAHLLDGKELTRERFNEAGADLIRRWPRESAYRLVPIAEEGSETPADWEKERATLQAKITEQQTRIFELMEKVPSNRPQRRAGAAA